MPVIPADWRLKSSDKVEGPRGSRRKMVISQLLKDNVNCWRWFFDIVLNMFGWPLNVPLGVHGIGLIKEEAFRPGTEFLSYKNNLGPISGCVHWFFEFRWISMAIFTWRILSRPHCGINLRSNRFVIRQLLPDSISAVLTFVIRKLKSWSKNPLECSPHPMQ